MNAPDKITLVDTGYEIFLSKNNQLEKIVEIYKQVDMDLIIYPTDIVINKDMESQLFNTFVNIQNTFSPELPIDECIDNVKLDINVFVTHLEKYNNINKKYNQSNKTEVPRVGGIQSIESFIGLNTRNDQPIESAVGLNEFPIESVKGRNPIEYVKGLNELDDNYATINFGFHESVKELNELDNQRNPIEYVKGLNELDDNYATIDFGNKKNDSFAKATVFDRIQLIKNNVLYLKSVNRVVVMSDSFDYSKLTFNDIIYIGQIQNCFINTYHKQLYTDVDSFKKLYTQLQSQKCNMTEIKNVFEILKQYILGEYNITDKQEHKIKSSILYNQFINELKKTMKDEMLTIQSFSNELINMGLKRKRYSDGFYYYGLISKKSIDTSIDTLKRYNSILDERKKELRILIAEDLDINRKILIEILNKNGYNNVLETRNGLECIKELEKNEYDVLLLDTKMPIINGDKVAQMISDFYKGITNNYNLVNKKKPFIVAMTAYNSIKDCERYKKVGFNRVLEKPYNKDKLLQVLNEVIF